MAVPLRRLSDLLAEANFLEAQVRVLQDSGPAHRTRNLQMRIATLHRRLDELERRLRLRAQELGHDQASMRDLRRRLAALSLVRPNGHGRERRSQHRQSQVG